MYQHLERPSFHSVEDYGRLFTDAAFWQPYVAEAAGRHGLSAQALRVGLPGTHPVFIVDERYVVKFFSDMFAGDASFPIERDIYRLIARAGGIPAPALVAHGELFGTDGGWPWPYLITSLLAGQNLGEAALSATEREAVVDWLAPVVRRIHTLPIEYTATLRPSWEAFERFLHAQRASASARRPPWDQLPHPLRDSLDAFLARPLLLPTGSAPMLIHADLNQDHVLGSAHEGGWLPTGIIDFGDAKVGDLAYELVALHLGLFNCDKQLLARFLQAYGLPAAQWPALLRRAMTMTVLHEFDVLGSLCRQFPAAAAAPSLDALAPLIWDPGAPGIQPD
jgi:aminoglycoside phosphotransferase (APT) family kinase protein